MSRVLFLVNHDVVIYNFRLEIVERLLTEGHEVHVSSPYGERIDDLISLGVHYHKVSIDRHGTNPINEIKLYRYYEKLYAEIRPDIIFGFTIKPNIYGALAAKKIPFIANITGLGTAVENPGISQRIFVILYKIAFRNIRKVFFQNEENREFFVKNNIALKKHELLPGSGVNLERFPLLSYPNDDVLKFVFIARIMKEKGIDYYLNSAEEIKKKYSDVEFHVCGFVEKEYEGKLDELSSNGTIINHGMVRDIKSVHETMHCLVFPSYYPEGLSNVLLEAASCGRPIITTNRSGCREVVDDGVNGFVVPIMNQEALTEAIEKIINMTNNQRKEMGLAGRRKVEQQFDRQIVVDKYLKEVENL